MMRGHDQLPSPYASGIQPEEDRSGKAQYLLAGAITAGVVVGGVLATTGVAAADERRPAEDSPTTQGDGSVDAATDEVGSDDSRDDLSAGDDAAGDIADADSEQGDPGGQLPIVDEGDGSGGEGVEPSDAGAWTPENHDRDGQPPAPTHDARPGDDVVHEDLTAPVTEEEAADFGARFIEQRDRELAGFEERLAAIRAAVVPTDEPDETPAAEIEGADAETPDAETPDAVVPDAVVPDAVVPDAVVPDAVVPDAVVPDAVVPDAVVPDAQASEPSAVETPSPALLAPINPKPRHGHPGDGAVSGPGSDVDSDVDVPGTEVLLEDQAVDEWAADETHARVAEQAGGEALPQHPVEADLPESHDRTPSWAEEVIGNQFVAHPPDAAHRWWKDRDDDRSHPHPSPALLTIRDDRDGQIRRQIAEAEDALASWSLSTDGILDFALSIARTAVRVDADLPPDPPDAREDQGNGGAGSPDGHQPAGAPGVPDLSLVPENGTSDEQEPLEPGSGDVEPPPDAPVSHSAPEHSAPEHSAPEPATVVTGSPDDAVEPSAPPLLELVSSPALSTEPEPEPEPEPSEGHALLARAGGWVERMLADEWDVVDSILDALEAWAFGDGPDTDDVTIEFAAAAGAGS